MSVIVTADSFIEDKGLRSKYLNKLNVLEKVKELITLPNTELMTTKMVAEWYDVSEKLIQWHIMQNKDELTENGLKVIEKDELKEFKRKLTSLVELGQSQSPLDQFGIGLRAKSLTILSKRAILNLGMLLRDSQVARRVRTVLLDIEESSSHEQKTSEIDREKELTMKVVFAGSEEEMLVALRELREYKDRHIKQLEEKLEEQKPKVSYYETIIQSKDAINITQIAKDYGLSGSKLNNILHEQGVQYKSNDQWVLYSKYQTEGYIKSHTTHFKKKNGEKGSKIHSKWTQKEEYSYIIF